MSNPSGSGLFGSGGGSGLFGGGNNTQPSSTNTSFSFGATSTPNASGTGSGLFGAPASGANTPKPSLFGGVTNSATDGASIARSASTPATSTPSLFGNANKPGGLFGATASTTPAGPPPATSNTFSFGQNATAAAKPAGSLFGGGNTTAPSGGLFGGGASATPSSENKPTFGAAGGSNLFGGASTTPASAPSSAPSLGAAFGTTPAAKPSLFGGAASTTPATAAPAAGGLFGAPKPATTPGTPAGGLFGGGAAAGPAQQKPSLFGGASTTPAGAAPTAAPATSAPSLFGGASTATTSASTPSLFGGATAAPATTSAPSLFGGAPTATSAASTPSLFGGATSSAATSSITPATSAPAVNTLIPKPATSTATSQPAAATSLFGAKPATTTSTAPATTAAAAPSLFGGATASSSAATAPATTATTATSSLFSKPGAPASSTAPATGTTATAGASSTTTMPSAANVNPASRLANKSMEEIINRWLSDTESYKKQFLSQAEAIKEWDKIIVDNGEKISKLFNETSEAEKLQARVETQLQYLENEQNELGDILSHYEEQIKEVFEGQMVEMQPADQERAKAYQLAEKVNDQLEEMGKGLTEMIGEINKASTTINKTTNADDPLSQIVRILNDHLSSLQWIDAHTTQLQEKLENVQKKNTLGGLGERWRGQGEDEFLASHATYRGFR